MSLDEQLIIEEYKTLREEALQLYRLIQNTIMQCIIFVGMMIFFYFSTLKDECYRSIIPLAIMPIALYVIIFTLLGINMRNGKINYYLALIKREHGSRIAFMEESFSSWSQWYSIYGDAPA